jgi:hypothetical protein
MTWWPGWRSRRVRRRVGGVCPLARGGVASFEVNLAPGHYGMICFLPDAKDGKPHHEHGMIQEFGVGDGAKISAR